MRAASITELGKHLLQIKRLWRRVHRFSAAPRGAVAGGADQRRNEPRLPDDGINQKGRRSFPISAGDAREFQSICGTIEEVRRLSHATLWMRTLSGPLKRIPSIPRITSPNLFAFAFNPCSNFVQLELPDRSPLIE